MRSRRPLRHIGRAASMALLTALLVAEATIAAGVTWSPAVAVGPLHRETCEHALAASATATGIRLHSVYTSGGGTIDLHRVFYRRSFDSGSTWPSGMALSTNDKAYAQCPTVAAAGRLVVVAWSQWLTSTTIRFRVSVDGGTSWGPERRLPTTRTPGKPSVAVLGSKIFIAWTDGSGAERWSRVAVSRDRGVTWALRRLDAHPSADDTSVPPTTLIAASGTRVFAAWLRTGATKLIGRVSVDSGATWQSPQVLATTFAPFFVPYISPVMRTRFSIAARPDRMAIAWTGPWVTGQATPAFVRVFAGGAWGSPATITAEPRVEVGLPYGYLSSPAVTLLASSRVGLAWTACYDLRTVDPIYGCGEAFGGPVDALWSESSNNGGSWTEPSVIDPDPAYAYIYSVSAVWTSANLRGVLASRANGEPEWDAALSFSRGAGLP